MDGNKKCQQSGNAPNRSGDWQIRRKSEVFKYGKEVVFILCLIIKLYKTTSPAGLICCERIESDNFSAGG